MPGWLQWATDFHPLRKLMQIPILSGLYADTAADLRTQYPRNMVPVPKQSGVSQGYIRPADGIELFGSGPGVGRGGYWWNGVLYWVMGSKLCSVSSSGAITELGDVGAGGPVTIDNGPDYLSIWSGGRLYYWDGSTLTQVTDTDLGNVIDGTWIAGYNLSTDGEFLIVTELSDKTAVNPLKYGTAEADPDPIVGVTKLLNEAYAIGRYTIEVFSNVGGDNFPFAPIEGAQVSRGAIGTKAFCKFGGSIAFVGSGKNEAPAVWAMAPGDATKLSTSEIDKLLLNYSEAELSACVVRAKVDKGHNWLMIHLPDVCLVYDLNASKAAQEPVWFELSSAVVGRSTYRARNLVWAYDRWIADDPTTSNLGVMTDEVASHYGEVVGWEFGTLMLYNEGRGGIVHDLELVALPGRVAFGADPVVWASYSEDGETWSMERPIAAGKQGERLKRLAWRGNGMVRNYRMQKFRGTSDAKVSFMRLEARVEPLNG
ncbi:MAG: hypothetical protein RL758_203 [Pseudomonadota bacterium]|jgi:hypothetical protein